MLGKRHGPRLLEGANLIEKLGCGLGAIAGILLFLITRSFIPTSLMIPLLIAGGVAALFVVTGWIVQMVQARGRRSHETTP